MTAPVVVAVDGTDDGRHALRYGIELALLHDAPLRLLHVRHENVVLAPMMPLLPDPTLRGIAEHVLREAAVDAHRLGWTGAELQSVLAHGPRVPAIVAHAKDARCLVLGTRSSAVQRLLTGSTTNGVAALAEVPVVCVPSAWDPNVEFRRVTVGIDGSLASRHLIGAGMAAAHDRDAGLTVLHAWRPVGLYDAAIGGRAFAPRWEGETRPAVEGLVEPVHARHPEVKVEVELRYERPTVALHAASSGSDLLVIGRHGLSPLLPHLLGTTARSVIRTASCPVLVVPAPVDEWR